MAKTKRGKKKVYVHEFSYINNNGVLVFVPQHYRSTPNIG